MKNFIKIALIFFLFFGKSYGVDFKEIKSEKFSFWFTKDDSIPIISLSFSIHGGSSQDPSGKEGITNLMTSVMDEGTSKYSGVKIREIKKLNGIKINITSQKSKIDGTFQVIASQADQGFEILDQILNYPKFEDNDIKKIKKQIEASLKIDESDISTLSNDNFNKFFFKKHKFSKKIKGTIESIKNITKADLKLHHKKLFNSNSLHIGASGNIEGEKLKGYLEEVFGKFNNELQPPVFKKFSDLPTGQKIVEVETPQSSVVFGHPGLSRNDDDYFALRIANYILGGGGFQSRLYKQIREKRGLVYSIYSYPISYKHDGYMLGGFQTRNSSVFETIKKVKEEWAKISNNGITEQELLDAKAYYKGSFTRNFTSTVSIANLLNIVQYYDLGKDYFDKRDEIIDNLKLNDINAMIRQKLSGDKLFFVIAGMPEEK